MCSDRNLAIKVHEHCRHVIIRRQNLALNFPFETFHIWLEKEQKIEKLISLADEIESHACACVPVLVGHRMPLTDKPRILFVLCSYLQFTVHCTSGRKVFVISRE